jgi:hypothetical protein
MLDFVCHCNYICSMLKCYQYLFLLLFLFTCDIGFSQQNLLNRIFTDFTESAAYGVVEDADCYYVGGTLKDSVDFNDKIFIKWIPKSPLAAVTKIWSIPDCNFCSYGRRTFIRTSDKGFAMTGYIAEAANGIHGFLIKFNSNCDSLWMKHFNDTVSNVNERYLRFFGFSETIDKGFILIGEINASGSHNHDIVLIKTDSHGNTEWRNNYGYSTRYDVGWSVVQTPDSGYLVGGYSRDYSLHHGADALVIKTDNKGNEMWHTFLGSSGDDGVAYVDISSDSNYLIVYSYSYKQESVSLQELCVVKLFPDKQFIWEKHYRIHSQSYVMTLDIADNNDILVAGTAYCKVNANTGYGYKAYIMRLDANGDSIWCRNYSCYPDTSGSSDSYIHDIKPDLNGGILACGEYRNHDLNINKSAWLLNTDHSGSYIAGIEEDNSLKSNRLLFLYPNPANDVLNIDFDGCSMNSIVIYNLKGSLVLNDKSGKKRLDISALSPGLYLLKLNNKYISKFVKN